MSKEIRHICPVCSNDELLVEIAGSLVMAEHSDGGIRCEGSGLPPEISPEVEGGIYLANNIGKDHNVATLSFSGDLTQASGFERFRKELNRVVGRNNTFVLVDLSQVTTMNIAAGDLLVWAHRCVRQNHGELVVGGINEGTANVLDVVTLYVTVRKTVKKARKALDDACCA